MQPAPLTPLTPLCLLVLVGCVPPAMGRQSAGSVAGDILTSIVLAGTTSGPSSTGTGSSGRPAPAATRVIGTAERYLGVPYKWGGSSPESGFDCSGYVKYVYGRQGVQLPRTSREQAGAGVKVTPRVASLRQGDLMLFAEARKPISHVAIYAGDGRIIHSSSSGGGVRYDDLGTTRGQWYVQHMVAARRLAVDGRSLVQSLRSLTIPDLPFDPPDGAPPPR
ncbi:MAG TPA: C40 family peptidase [Gemmatimonadaceae bacterium]|nr:C40 family peptidase [Gemmatimonadaceae bacterium]